ncbi:MAG: MBL fold metallo-hydrolase [Clostridia bacterium]|nr:MBL fold metallo-hydrolase [Clostridia bacterium]
MKIAYLGHSCFKITTANGTVLITDPYKGVGYELPRGLTADAVTVSHAHFDHNNTKAIATACVIDGAQTREINGVRITGVKTFHDEKNGALRGENIVYNIVADGICVCHLGDLGEKYSGELVKKIGKVDVLLIPVGGTYTIDAIEAKKYADAINARVVIPMHYKPEDGTIDITDAKPFLSLFDGVDYSYKNGEADLSTIDFSNDERKIIYLERV